MPILKNNNVPIGQDWLIERMLTIIPNTDKDGVCFGVAFMGVQAILANDLTIFNHRLEIMSLIPTQKFAMYIKYVKNERTNIVNRVKKRIGGIRKLTDDEKKELIGDQDLQNKLYDLDIIMQDIVKLKHYSKRKLTFEKQRRIKLHWYNAYLQKKINDEIAKLDKKHQIILSIPNFLQGIELYHQPQFYPDIFTSDAIIIQENFSNVMSLIASQSIEKLGNAHVIKSFCGVYDSSTLIKTLKSLSNMITSSHPKLTQPIALLLNNSHHAVTISYDPNLNLWYYIEANYLKKLYVYNYTALAAYLTYSFTNNDVFILRTTVFATKSDIKQIIKCINLWSNDKEFQLQHKPTEEKDKLVDSNNCSLLYIAAASGDIDIVKKILIFKNINIDINLKDGRTPLGIAIQHGHTHIVKALIDAKVNLSITCKGHSLLSIAADRGNLEMVKMLINAGADLNCETNEGPAPLLIAAERGFTTIVDCLLKTNKVNIDHKDKVIGVTALFLAARSGNLEIVKMLLEKGANPKLPVKMMVNDLYVITERRNNKLIEKLISKHIGYLSDYLNYFMKFFNPVTPTTKEILITPAEIAEIMGHTIIFNTLLASEKKSLEEEPHYLIKDNPNYFSPPYP